MAVSRLGVEGTDDEAGDAGTALLRSGASADRIEARRAPHPESLLPSWKASTASLVVSEAESERCRVSDENANGASPSRGNPGSGRNEAPLLHECQMRSDGWAYVPR